MNSNTYDNNSNGARINKSTINMCYRELKCITHLTYEYKSKNQQKKTNKQNELWQNACSDRNLGVKQFE